MVPKLRCALCLAVLIGLARVGDSQRSAAAADEVIPKDYPQIEVQRLRLTNLREERLPELLLGAFTFANREKDSIEAGRLEFTVKQNALILLLVSWDDEEGTGDWKSEVVTRRQLGQSWIDLGPASWDESKVLFVRECRAGDAYSIRTSKCDPPLPILAPLNLLKEKRRGASTLREAMKLALRPIPQTPEELVAYLAYGVPEGAAVIAANNMQLLPLEGESIPPYLQGAKVYRRMARSFR